MDYSKSTSPKSISVIIPCRNERTYIASCIDSMIQCNYDKKLMEIIVVDGMSDDGTVDILNKYASNYPYIKIIHNSEKSTPVSLNVGIKAAVNEYVMIASAHSSFTVDYISTLIKSMQELNADVVGGAIETIVINKTRTSSAIIKVLTSKFGVGNSMFRIGVKNPVLADTVPFGIYKRSLFEKVGLYDERLIRNHDIELSKRILSHGYKIYLIPQATCYYYARENYRGLGINNYRNGLWNVLTLYITKKFKSLSIRHYVPLLFMLSIIVTILLSLILSTCFLYVFAALIILYNAFVIYSSIKIKDASTRFVNLFVCFYVIHFSYGFGSFVGLFGIKKLIQR